MFDKIHYVAAVIDTFMKMNVHNNYYMLLNFTVPPVEHLGLFEYFAINFHPNYDKLCKV